MVFLFYLGGEEPDGPRVGGRAVARGGLEDVFLGGHGEVVLNSQGAREGEDFTHDPRADGVHEFAD